MKDTTNRTKIYSICNKLECAKDAELHYKYNEHLADNLQSDDVNLQSVAKNGFDGANYLGDTLRINTLKKVIDWLRNLNNPLQISALNVVIENWKLISEISYQKYFIEFVFNKLVDAEDKTKIEIGFNALIKLKPKYLDYKSNFDNLKLKISREKNEAQKIFLIKNILSIIDESAKDEDKKFRDDIVKIKIEEENKKITEGSKKQDIEAITQKQKDV